MIFCMTKKFPLLWCCIVNVCKVESRHIRLTLYAYIYLSMEYHIGFVSFVHFSSHHLLLCIILYCWYPYRLTDHWLLSDIEIMLISTWLISKVSEITSVYQVDSYTSLGIISYASSRRAPIIRCIFILFLSWLVLLGFLNSMKLIPSALDVRSLSSIYIQWNLSIVTTQRKQKMWPL